MSRKCPSNFQWYPERNWWTGSFEFRMVLYPGGAKPVLNYEWTTYRQNRSGISCGLLLFSLNRWQLPAIRRRVLANFSDTDVRISLGQYWKVYHKAERPVSYNKGIIPKRLAVLSISCISRHFSVFWNTEPYLQSLELQLKTESWGHIRTFWAFTEILERKCLSISFFTFPIPKPCSQQ